MKLTNAQDEVAKMPTPFEKLALIRVAIKGTSSMKIKMQEAVKLLAKIKKDDTALRAKEGGSTTETVLWDEGCEVPEQSYPNLIRNSEKSRKPERLFIEMADKTANQGLTSIFSNCCSVQGPESSKFFMGKISTKFEESADVNFTRQTVKDAITTAKNETLKEFNNVIAHNVDAAADNIEGVLSGFIGEDAAGDLVEVNESIFQAVEKENYDLIGKKTFDVLVNGFCSKIFGEKSFLGTKMEDVLKLLREGETKDALKRLQEGAAKETLDFLEKQANLPEEFKELLDGVVKPFMKKIVEKEKITEEEITNFNQSMTKYLTNQGKKQLENILAEYMGDEYTKDIIETIGSFFMGCKDGDFSKMKGTLKDKILSRFCSEMFGNEDLAEAMTDFIKALDGGKYQEAFGHLAKDGVVQTVKLFLDDDLVDIFSGLLKPLNDINFEGNLETEIVNKMRETFTPERIARLAAGFSTDIVLNSVGAGVAAPLVKPIAKATAGAIALRLMTCLNELKEAGIDAERIVQQSGDEVRSARNDVTKEQVIEIYDSIPLIPISALALDIKEMIRHDDDVQREKNKAGVSDDDFESIVNYILQSHLFFISVLCPGHFFCDKVGDKEYEEKLIGRIEENASAVEKAMTNLLKREESLNALNKFLFSDDFVTWEHERQGGIDALRHSKDLLRTLEKVNDGVQIASGVATVIGVILLFTPAAPVGAALIAGGAIVSGIDGIVEAIEEGSFQSDVKKTIDRDRDASAKLVELLNKAMDDSSSDGNGDKEIDPLTLTILLLSGMVGGVVMVETFGSWGVKLFGKPARELVKLSKNIGTRLKNVRSALAELGGELAEDVAKLLYLGEEKAITRAVVRDGLEAIPLLDIICTGYAAIEAIKDLVDQKSEICEKFGELADNLESQLHQIQKMRESEHKSKQVIENGAIDDALRLDGLTTPKALNKHLMEYCLYRKDLPDYMLGVNQFKSLMPLPRNYSGPNTIFTIQRIIDSERGPLQGSEQHLATWPCMMLNKNQQHEPTVATCTFSEKTLGSVSAVSFVPVDFKGDMNCESILIEDADSNGAVAISFLIFEEEVSTKIQHLDVGPIWNQNEASSKISNFLNNVRPDLRDDGWSWTGNWSSSNGTSYASFKKEIRNLKVTMKAQLQSDRFSASVVCKDLQYSGFRDNASEKFYLQPRVKIEDYALTWKEIKSLKRTVNVFLYHKGTCSYLRALPLEGCDLKLDRIGPYGLDRFKLSIRKDERKVEYFEFFGPFESADRFFENKIRNWLRENPGFVLQSSRRIFLGNNYWEENCIFVRRGPRFELSTYHHMNVFNADGTLQTHENQKSRFSFGNVDSDDSKSFSLPFVPKFTNDRHGKWTRHVEHGNHSDDNRWLFIHT